MPKEFGSPGPRALYPDVATSKSLGRCSILAQLLFDRLISQADDQGRLEDGAAYVKAICLPLIEKATTRAVEGCLAEIAREGMVQRYQKGGRDLLQLTSWWGYQGSMRWAYPSRYPPPDGHEDQVRRPPTKPLPQNAADHRGSAPQSAEVVGSIPPSRAEADADAVRPFQPESTGPESTGINRSALTGARDGLNHVDPETAATGEGITGHTFLSAGFRVQSEFDRLIEDHGAARVSAAMGAVSDGKRLSWTQLVYAVRNDLEPLPASKRQTAEERDRDEIEEARAAIPTLTPEKRAEHERWLAENTVGSRNRA